MQNEPVNSQTRQPNAGPALTPEFIHLPTSPNHQLFTLIGLSFACFEILFLYLYFDNFWFNFDISWLGIPAILLTALVAHFILKFLETPLACKIYGFVWKGKPAIPYKHWLNLNTSGITYGIKHIRWEVIEELDLTLFGNILVKSRILHGQESKSADIVLKFPFGVADFSKQKFFLSRVKQQVPAIILNKKLTKLDNSSYVKGTQIITLASALIMALLLLDLGLSSFYYLQMLKNYHLAEVAALNSKNLQAIKYFNQAENLRTHPFPYSFASSRFLGTSSVAAGIREQRSQILFLLGKKQEAIEEGLKALELAPKNLRLALRQVRLLANSGEYQKSQEALKKVIKDHPDSLMPKLYLLAINKNSANIAKIYQEQLDACYENTFGEEPRWPPGGNCFFTELFYSRDLRFIFDRLLKN